MKNTLPIDIVPNTQPPRFQWRQKLKGVFGDETVQFEGMIPPSMEGPIIELIALVKSQAKQIADLEMGLVTLTEKLAQAEKMEDQPPPVPPSPPPQQYPSSLKRRKG